MTGWVYAYRTMPSHDGDAKAWAALAPQVPEDRFVRHSTLHGVRHTQRVHIHAQRLTSELRWGEADVRLVLSAALWHDIGRTDDSEDPRHGAQGAARALQLGLLEALPTAEGDLVLFALVHHCLDDEDAEDGVTWWHAARLRGAARRPGDESPAVEARRLAEPERALRILWLLKDADALDRVRLHPWEAAGAAPAPADGRLVAFRRGAVPGQRGSICRTARLATRRLRHRSAALTEAAPAYRRPRAAASAAMDAGVVPQQPPTMPAPFEG